MNDFRKRRDNICDMLRGNINRMCVTDEVEELRNMCGFAMKRLNNLYALNLEKLERREKKNEKQVYEVEWVDCDDDMPERYKMVMITYGEFKDKKKKLSDSSRI